MYLLSKLSGALHDLLAACKSVYPDGACHAATNVAYVVHRLHQTRQPDCEMARHPWKLQAEPLLPLVCRCLAALYKLRDHTGLSGLAYDPAWIEAILTQTVRYLDHLLGDPGASGDPVPDAPDKPTDGPANAKLCLCQPDAN